MAELPHMPMFWSDYFGDTRHLTCLEHGAYLQLMGEYWLSGHSLPDDDVRLARLVHLSKKEWLAIRETLAEYFAVSGGVWAHNRIERELAKARRKVEQASNAGKASAASRSNGRSTDVQRKSNGRSIPVQLTRTRTIKNPLTPKSSAVAEGSPPLIGEPSAPDQIDAHQIGELIKSLGTKEKTK